MRNAILYRYEKQGDGEDDEANWVRKEVSHVKFHQFGVSYDERNGCVGSFSSAIIEMPDGMLENVPVELIQLVQEDVTIQ